MHFEDVWILPQILSFAFLEHVYEVVLVSFCNTKVGIFRISLKDAHFNRNCDSLLVNVYLQVAKKEKIASRLLIL